MKFFLLPMALLSSVSLAGEGLLDCKVPSAAERAPEQTVTLAASGLIDCSDLIPGTVCTYFEEHDEFTSFHFDPAVLAKAQPGERVPATYAEGFVYKSFQVTSQTATICVKR